MAFADSKDNEALLAIDRLLPVARSALDRAAMVAADIDLIVTLSLSPDRLAVDSAIIGPRIGHPMQRALGAERAYVFDLMDASLAKALHIIDVFAQVQGYRRVLVLRTEYGPGLDQSECGAYKIADGAAALIGIPDGQSRLTRAPIYGVNPLVFVVNPHIRFPLDVKASLRFSPPSDFAARYKKAVATALEQLPPLDAGQVVESWLPEASTQSCAGPFSLPLALGHFLAEGGCGTLAVASFDPFTPAIDAVSIEFGGVFDA